MSRRIILQRSPPAARKHISGRQSSPSGAPTRSSGSPELDPDPNKASGLRRPIPQQQQRQQHLNDARPDGDRDAVDGDYPGRRRGTGDHERRESVLPSPPVETYGRPVAHDNYPRDDGGDVGGESLAGGRHADNSWATRGGSVSGGGNVRGGRAMYGAVRREGRADENDVIFGYMAPCWRLLEKAQRFIDEVWKQTVKTAARVR